MFKPFTFFQYLYVPNHCGAGINFINQLAQDTNVTAVPFSFPTKLLPILPVQQLELTLNFYTVCSVLYAVCQ